MLTAAVVERSVSYVPFEATSHMAVIALRPLSTSPASVVGEAFTAVASLPASAAGDWPASVAETPAASSLGSALASVASASGAAASKGGATVAVLASVVSVVGDVPCVPSLGKEEIAGPAAGDAAGKEGDRGARDETLERKGSHCALPSA